jgi:hypothetical protein
VLGRGEVSVAEDDEHGRVDRRQLVVGPALDVSGGCRQAAQELVEVVRVRRQPEVGLLEVVKILLRGHSR